MKNFYYYSESKLRYVQIKYLKWKICSFFCVPLVLAAAIIFSGSFIQSSPENLKAEGISSVKIKEILNKYQTLEDEFEDLIKQNNELRLAANLAPLTEDEIQFGIGGESFKDLSLAGATNDDIEKINETLVSLENKFVAEKENYSVISQKLDANKDLYESIPAIIPSEGRLANHGYGMRTHPVLGVKRMHNGIDIITNTGTKVKAPGKGKVSFAGRNGGYGICVEIDHGYGYKTIFAHLSEIKVKLGQKIKRGDIIALTGNTGLSTGPHLHYEIHHKGKKLDPEDFFYDDVKIF